MQKACRNCGRSFVITQDDLSFYERTAPVLDGKKFTLPSPTLCPACRLQRRLAYRNQIYVYRRPSSTTGEPIFSMFPEGTPFPVIANDEWWSDRWNPLNYGTPFDFSRPFFPQFEELRNSVPHRALSAHHVENCDYCNNISLARNCYLTFSTSRAEDCLYCETAWHSRDCIDCTYTNASELCEDCVMCERCYNLQNSAYCESCSDSIFLLHCTSCEHCFGCTNLRRKQYCIFNEQFSKQEYEVRLREFRTNSHRSREEICRRVHSFFLTQPRPHTFMESTENASGDFLFHAKDVRESFLIRNGERLTHCFHLENARDCLDFSLTGNNAERIYECSTCGINIFNLKFCVLCHEGCSDLQYCVICVGCQDCFGCVSLRHHRYCILNKQYTKKEYERLLPQILEHMTRTGEYGEFFAIALSPIPYNHSLAQRFYPLTHAEVETRGLQWHEKHSIDLTKAMETDALPDGLPASDDPIIVKSARSSVPFLITAQEISRYRKLHVPLPRQTYSERMEERASQMRGVQLYERACQRTGRKILTTFPPDTPWIVWDREEYEKVFEG